MVKGGCSQIMWRTHLQKLSVSGISNIFKESRRQKQGIKAGLPIASLFCSLHFFNKDKLKKKKSAYWHALPEVGCSSLTYKPLLTYIIICIGRISASILRGVTCRAFRACLLSCFIGVVPNTRFLQQDGEIRSRQISHPSLNVTQSAKHPLNVTATVRNAERRQRCDNSQRINAVYVHATRRKCDAMRHCRIDINAAAKQTTSFRSLKAGRCSIYYTFINAGFRFSIRYMPRERGIYHILILVVLLKWYI